ncbi:MAG: 2-oxoacid:acceptor oxidoreductase family protein [Thermoproteota archaeon]
MRLQIIIAGRGGQGILLAGYLLGKALINEGYYVVNGETYSAETRGGFSRSDLIVFTEGDEEVDLIKVSRADVAVFMYKEQIEMYKNLVNPSAKLVMVDSTFTDKVNEPWPRVELVPFTRIAEEKVGTGRVANIVMLGVFTYVTGLVKPETVIETIKETVRPRWREPNIKAFNAGYSYAEEAGMEKVKLL